MVSAAIVLSFGVLFLLFRLQLLSVKLLGRIEERQISLKHGRNRAKGRWEPHFTWDKKKVEYKLSKKKHVGCQGTGRGYKGDSEGVLLLCCILSTPMAVLHT